MRKQIAIYSFSLFLILLLTACAGADVIKLKNGRSLEGAIISETKNAVVIDIGIGEASLAKSDIVSIERSKEDNAAIYYIRAINSATYIETGEINKKLEKIRKNKWHSGEKEIEEILNENQKCLGEIEKALPIKKCDFYFEQKYRYQQQKEQALHPRDVTSLGWIIILKGRLLENRQKFGEAIDWYLSALTFASQIAQADDPAVRAGSLEVEKEAYSLIRIYLNSVNVDKKNCVKILDYLDGPGKLRFTLNEFVENGKEWFVGFFQIYEHDIVLWSREKTRIEKKIRRQAVNFAKELLKNAAELADKYFGAFSKAAASDNVIDWKSAYDEYDSLIKNNSVQSLTDDIDRGKFVRESFENLENIESKDPKKIVVTVLIYHLSDIKMGIDYYKDVLREISELKVLAKLKSVTTYKK